MSGIGRLVKWTIPKVYSGSGKQAPALVVQDNGDGTYDLMVFMDNLVTTEATQNLPWFVPKATLDNSGATPAAWPGTFTEPVPFRSLAYNAALNNAVGSIAVTMSPAEIDTNYLIVAETSWDTSAWQSSKTASGFTINFGTKTPDGNQTISYGILRI